MIKAKAKAMIKAKAKAIPPLPLRSLVAVTKSSQDLYWFASYWGLGNTLHPRGKISTVPKWSRARIPGWSRPGPCQCPWFFLDFVTFSAGFLGFSKVFVRFTHALQTFCEGVVFGVPRFAKKNANPFSYIFLHFFLQRKCEQDLSRHEDK